MSKTKEGTEDAEAGGCGGEYLDRPEVLESGELYGYLERYKKAFERLIELEGSQYAKRVEAGNAAENVWTEQSKTEVLSAECPRCLEPYKHSVKHTSANFSEYMHSELVRTLSDVEQINEDVTACTYDTYLKRSHLFYYVNNFFVHVQTLASALDSSSPVPACPLSAQSSEQRAEVQHLRHMLNVLFYHYRAPAPSIARSNLLSIDFNKDVADGIAGVGGVLLRAASYSDHLFLLRHCLACPALAPALVQLPPAAAWTPGTVRFYAKAVRTAADVVLSAESAHQGNNIGNSSRDMAFTLCSTADASGACFFPQEAPAMAAVVVSVSEEEVNNVFVQLDPRPLVDFLRKAISVGGPTAVLACSEDLEELLDALCSTLRPIALMKYLELGRTVTRALAVVLSFIASPIAVTAAAAPAVPDDNGDSAAVAAHCLCISQRVFDMSLIKVLLFSLSLFHHTALNSVYFLTYFYIYIDRKVHVEARQGRSCFPGALQRRSPCGSIVPGRGVLGVSCCPPLCRCPGKRRTARRGSRQQRR